MKAKPFNTSNPAFHYGHIMSETQRGNTGVFFRVNHDGEKFILVEAYMYAAKSVEEGTIAELLPFLNEVTNEWFNAGLEPVGNRIRAFGLAPIIGKYEYRAELKQVEKLVAGMKTKRTLRHEETARLKELHK